MIRSNGKDSPKVDSEELCWAMKGFISKPTVSFLKRETDLLNRTEVEQGKKEKCNELKYNQNNLFPVVSQVGGWKRQIHALQKPN